MSMKAKVCMGDNFKDLTLISFYLSYNSTCSLILGLLRGELNHILGDNLAQNRYFCIIAHD